MLIAGGLGETGPLESSFIWDDGGLTTVGDLAVPRAGHSANLLSNGKVLIAGGEASGGSVTGSAELYDPDFGVWFETQGLITPRTQHASVTTLGGEVLVTGGMGSSSTALAQCELFHPAQESWGFFPAMTTERRFHTLTALENGDILAVGGYNEDDEVLSSSELWESATGTWRTISSMITGRARHQATLLADGRVLVSGGVISEATATAEIFDPATERWSATGSLETARFAHTATLQLDGTVLVAGGRDRSSASVASTEIYNPRVGQWSTGNPLPGNTPRAGHTATFLGEPHYGAVLVVGGGSYSGPESSPQLVSQIAVRPGPDADHDPPRIPTIDSHSPAISIWRGLLDNRESLRRRYGGERRGERLVGSELPAGPDPFGGERPGGVARSGPAAELLGRSHDADGEPPAPDPRSGVASPHRGQSRRQQLGRDGPGDLQPVGG